MLPTLRIHVTPTAFRAELEGTGILREEEAVLAFIWPTVALMPFGIACVVGLFGNIFLGVWLAAPQMSIGEQGITLRLSGWYSRPLRVPHARIRHGGQEVSLKIPSKSKMPLDELELALVSRLAPKQSYRAPGCG